jgi:hypothetical protein
MDFYTLKRIIRTIIHLKFKQVYYQTYYRLFFKWIKGSQKQILVPINFQSINWQNRIDSAASYDNKSFRFLNLSYSFDEIDWNFSKYGKLWTYNLNYFDFLQQGHFTKEEGLELIRDFCAKSSMHKDAYEPYPISLRIINWVKFLSRYGISDETINKQLYQDIWRLHRQLEYHILANHLFENAFGLLFGAYYFQDEHFYNCAKKLLRSELNEQILQDGAHYELTPMYHQIILYRVLDCYQLVSKNQWKNHELANVLKETASKMLGWLRNIQFNSSALPLVNDSTEQIAPSSSELIAYAMELRITPASIPLKESGYRFFRASEFELFADVGQIAPSYQPGHSHADTLNFIFFYNGNPIVVDTSISTYDKNERRQIERSTNAHNTVTINDENSSEVWSGFRVGRRAITTIIEDTDIKLVASHNGYRHLKATHTRTFEISSSIKIKDEVNSNSSKNKGHIHFHPSVELAQMEDEIIINNELVFLIENAKSIDIVDYKLALGYNNLVSAKKVIYEFDNNTSLNISKLKRP